MEKAGDLASDNYRNMQAIDFYDRLLKYTENNSGKMTNILFKKAEVLKLIGKWNEALQIYEKVLVLSKPLNNQVLMVNCMSAIADLLKRRGRIEESNSLLDEALSIAEQIDYKKGISYYM